MQSRYKYTFFFACLFGLFTACSDDSQKLPDVRDIEPNISVRRFELDFFAKEQPDLVQLKRDYPLFWDIYFGTIMAEFAESDTFTDAQVLDMHQNPYLQALLDTCRRIHSDLSGLEKDLGKAMQYYRHYTGDARPKTLVTFLSEYGVGACTFGDDTLGLGLDMYLGSEFGGYDPSVFPQFIRGQMRPEYMLPQVMKAFAQNMLPPLKSERMLDIMLNNGKVLYLMDLFLPEVTAAVKMEYTEEQMKWVAENEARIWNHFVSRELLYSTRRQEYQKLVGPSPNAPNMPAEAPGQTANYIGWQMIKSFVKRNPDVSLQDMLAIDDGQKIMEMARYRPK
jgi:hypothetical protein